MARPGCFGRPVVGVLTIGIICPGAAAFPSRAGRLTGSRYRAVPIQASISVAAS